MLRLQAARDAPKEKRQQAIESWLEVASPTEVRKHWRKWMGQIPGWAK